MYSQREGEREGRGETEREWIYAISGMYACQEPNILDFSSNEIEESQTISAPLNHNKTKRANERENR